MSEPTLKINEIFFSIQGESTLAGKPTVFVRTSICNLRCTWCLAPETPVLMSDFTQRSIATLQEGDEVVGIAQIPGQGHQRVVRTRVLAVGEKIASERIGLQTEQGQIICTPDHKLWHSQLKGTTRYGRWRRADRFAVGDSIKSMVVERNPIPNFEAYRLGYLAGVADGDGCFWKFKPTDRKRNYLRFRVAANDREMLERFRSYGEEFGFEFSSREHTRVGFSKEAEQMPSLYLLGGDEAVTRFRDKICEPLPEGNNPSFSRGYLAGIFDAEGSLSCGNLRISQGESNSDIRVRIQLHATKLGFATAIEEKGIRIGGGTAEHLKFFAFCNPAISRKRGDFFGRSLRDTQKIQEIKKEAPGPVITLTTECGSFVANGLVVRNCDTKYAYFKGEVMTVSEVMAKVKEFGGQYVCLTGGEPLGQQGTIELMQRLIDEGQTVSLETNGSFSIKDVPLSVVKVVDIKCPDSGESDSMAWENLDLIKPHDNFKFVVASKTDFDWAQDVCERHQLYTKCTVLYSPVYGKVKPNELASWILNAKAPVTMQMQMHKGIWGPNERGV